MTLASHNHAASAALSASEISLRIIIILNWVYGAFILALLVTSIIAGRNVAAGLGFMPSLLGGMRVVAVFGLVAVPLHYVVLRRLLDMVESVRTHDPFVRQNASRLQTIAWALLALQVVSLIIAAIARLLSTPQHPLHLSAGFSTSGWLAVLLLFVLARVFNEGTQMRDELEGTI